MIVTFQEFFKGGNYFQRGVEAQRDDLYREGVKMIRLFPVLSCEEQEMVIQWEFENNGEGTGTSVWFLWGTLLLGF